MIDKQRERRAVKQMFARMRRRGHLDADAVDALEAKALARLGRR